MNYMFRVLARKNTEMMLFENLPGSDYTESDVVGTLVCDQIMKYSCGFSDQPSQLTVYIQARLLSFWSYIS